MSNPLPQDGAGWGADDRACLTLSGYWAAGPEHSPPAHSPPERAPDGPELERA